MQTQEKHSQAAVLGLQHLLAMYSGSILVPIMIATALGYSTEQLTYLISTDIFMCGVATFLQLQLNKYFGIGLPVVLGVAFQSVAPLIMIGQSHGSGAMFGALIASGIAPALYAAEALNVPMIFAKKAKNITMNEGILTAEVYSFTKQVTSTVSIASKFLTPEDKVLIVDDFLANGQAAKGLIQIIEEAGAHVEAVGIVIEKSFQDGRALLEEAGYPVVSLARLDRFENGQVVFKEADI